MNEEFVKEMDKWCSDAERKEHHNRMSRGSGSASSGVGAGVGAYGEEVSGILSLRVRYSIRVQYLQPGADGSNVSNYFTASYAFPHNSRTGEPCPEVDNALAVNKIAGWFIGLSLTGRIPSVVKDKMKENIKPTILRYLREEQDMVCQTPSHTNKMVVMAKSCGIHIKDEFEPAALEGRQRLAHLLRSQAEGIEEDDGVAAALAQDEEEGVEERNHVGQRRARKKQGSSSKGCKRNKH